jgi:hypothetical protein
MTRSNTARDRRLTAEDVASIIGPADDGLVMAIMDTGADAAELLEAYQRANANEHLGRDLKRPLAGRTAAVYDLLVAEMEPPEEE